MKKEGMAEPQREPSRNSPDNKEPTRSSKGIALDRRKFLTAAASLVGMAAAQAVIPSLHAEAPSSPPVPDDPTRVPGAPPTPYGQRAGFEQATRLPGTSHSLTPLQTLHGIVTPAALHFERHHNGVPTIDPARHRLLIHGLVKRPMIFTVDDLERLPASSRLAFLECSGNSHDLWLQVNPDFTVQDTHGLTSTSEWTGVKLSTLLEAVGVQRGASWMLAEGSDAAGMDRSVPVTHE